MVRRKPFQGGGEEQPKVAALPSLTGGVKREEQPKVAALKTPKGGEERGKERPLGSLLTFGEGWTLCARIASRDRKEQQPSVAPPSAATFGCSSLLKGERSKGRSDRRYCTKCPPLAERPEVAPLALCATPSGEGATEGRFPSLKKPCFKKDCSSLRGGATKGEEQPLLRWEGARTLVCSPEASLPAEQGWGCFTPHQRLLR